jgi:hypothetical protein
MAALVSEQVDVQSTAQKPPADVEAQTPVAQECEKEFLRRTGSEWLAFMPALGSITMIVFGCLYFSDCSGIPSLPAYAIVFGSLSILNGVIGIAFRTEKAKVAGGDGGAAGKVQALVGLTILSCAVWGAVITWGETTRFSDSPDCKNQLFVAGFISSVIPWIVITLMLLGLLGMTLKKKYGSKAAETLDNPTATIAQEEQVDKETNKEASLV